VAGRDGFLWRQSGPKLPSGLALAVQSDDFVQGCASRTSTLAAASVREAHPILRLHRER
jgi:hypothetical protein